VNEKPEERKKSRTRDELDAILNRLRARMAEREAENPTLDRSPKERPRPGASLPPAKVASQSRGGDPAARLAARPEPLLKPPVTPKAAPVVDTDDEDPGRYEGHLAEFPWFILDKKQRVAFGQKPLVYSDTINGPNGEGIPRKWETHPGTYGFGGPSTADLLYELLQLYVEQGCTQDHIHFGTLRTLFRRLHPNLNPSRSDYTRLRRDLDILCGYRFNCENAFWDRTKKAYVHLRQWALFAGWMGFTSKPGSLQEELPFGAIEVSKTLQAIARSRGFFCLGFESDLFHTLKPLEQRLAVYLAKMFISQTVHRRAVEDLAAAMPIHSERADTLRLTLKRTAEGLLAAKVPILRSYAFEKGRDGRWHILFHRARRPRQNYGIPGYAARELAPVVLGIVDELVAFTESPQSRMWFGSCVEVLGPDIAYFCFGQLKEACTVHQVKDRGALLTKIFKDKAKELGRTLH